MIALDKLTFPRIEKRKSFFSRVLSAVLSLFWLLSLQHTIIFTLPACLHSHSPSDAFNDECEALNGCNHEKILSEMLLHVLTLSLFWFTLSRRRLACLSFVNCWHTESVTGSFKVCQNFCEIMCFKCQSRSNRVSRHFSSCFHSKPSIDSDV